MRCKACGLGHRPWIRCEMAKALQKLEAPPAAVLDKPKTEVPVPIKQAQEFIKRLPGRPRVYPDPKIRRKEYMKEWRKRKSLKSSAGAD